jgi:hypothetical protein
MTQVKAEPERLLHKANNAHLFPEKWAHVLPRFSRYLDSVNLDARRT